MLNCLSRSPFNIAKFLRVLSNFRRYELKTGINERFIPNMLKRSVSMSQMLRKSICTRIGALQNIESTIYFGHFSIYRKKIWANYYKDFPFSLAWSKRISICCKLREISSFDWLPWLSRISCNILDCLDDKEMLALREKIYCSFGVCKFTQLNRKPLTESTCRFEMLLDSPQ